MTANDTVVRPERPSSRSPWVRGGAAYVPRKPDPRVRWFLDANEGRPAPSVVAAIGEALAGRASGVCRYPSFGELESAAAAAWGVDPARVVATAGGDDAIGRVVASRLAPGAKILVHEPAFEMFGAYARSRGAATLGLRWLDGEPFPLEATIEAIRRRPSIGLATVVSPSNPTGGVVSEADALAVAAACADGGAAMLFDAAYGEYADEDPSARLISDGSAYVVRSFSKAYGLAGLRIGYVVAPDPGSAAALRSCGMPYPSSGLACAAALAAMADRPAMLSSVAAARAERAVMAERLRALGARVAESGANFVLARVHDPAGLAGAMARAGVAVRTYGGQALLADAVRVSCPCDPAGLAAVIEALDGAEEFIR
ncbi:MAG TPA: aminotransferase class I/II-fold pyridoxal phosphate-dependent enzyme [Spirochaetia bacterium]|nr:aminotransferase class I/II-fold pyridoxal phosphate-dependent enzyme [Spirochaetia bacterium]